MKKADYSIGLLKKHSVTCSMYNLTYFQNNGYWLVDIVDERGKNIKKADFTAINQGISQLSKRIRDEKPEIVVSILRRIRPHVEKAIDMSDHNVEHVNLPFPMGKWRREFMQGLEDLLEVL